MALLSKIRTTGTQTLQYYDSHLCNRGGHRVTKGPITKDKGICPQVTQSGMERDGLMLLEMEQQFKMYELFISEIFHLLFSDHV